MRFESPTHLWALLVLALIALLGLWLQRKSIKDFERFAQVGLWKTIAPEYDVNRLNQKFLIWVSALFFLILAWARPQWGMTEEKVKLSGLDVALVLDVSTSMEVEDISPSRLAKGKHFLGKIIDGLQGDRVGIVGFAGSAFLISPMTNDLGYAKESLDLMNTQSAGLQGTNISLGLDAAVRALERGTLSSPVEGVNQSGSQVIVLVSDGEEHEPEAAALASRLGSMGIRLYVFGVGTQKGGPIPIRDQEGRMLTYKRDRSGKTVTSSFNPAALTEIANAGGGTYWNVTDSEVEGQEMLKEIGALQRGDYAEKVILVFQERFQIPLAIALGLMILEMVFLPYRKRVLNLPLQYGARAILALCLLVQSPSIFADAFDEVQSFQKNNQGLEQFRKGELDQALKSFGEAQALNPYHPGLKFNEATLRAKKGDLEGGIPHLQNAANDALKMGDPKLGATSLFNLGVAQGQKGDMEASLQSYLSALTIAKQVGDPELEKDIRKNIELLVKQEEQRQNQKSNEKDKSKNQADQETKEQEDQTKKDQDSGQGEDQKKDPKGQSQKDEKEKEEEKKQEQRANKDQPVEDPEKSRKRQEFKSGQLDKDDAERVMNELSQREKELRERQKHRASKHQSAGEKKDW